MLEKLPRRALVLTDEKARHPFRRSLPPHVCATLIGEANAHSLREAFAINWRSMLTTYSATFVAVSVFVA